jgi:hypothetical protein
VREDEEKTGLGPPEHRHLGEVCGTRIAANQGGVQHLLGKLGYQKDHLREGKGSSRIAYDRSACCSPVYAPRGNDPEVLLLRNTSEVC